MRPGWTRHGPKGKNGGWWKHEASGWLAQHCAHPTAIFPWFLVDPVSHRAVFSHNGFAFSLLDAMNTVEAFLVGKFRLEEGKVCRMMPRYPVDHTTTFVSGKEWTAEQFSTLDLASAERSQDQLVIRIPNGFRWLACVRFGRAIPVRVDGVWEWREVA